MRFGPRLHLALEFLPGGQARHSGKVVHDPRDHPVLLGRPDGDQIRLCCFVRHFLFPAAGHEKQTRHRAERTYLEIHCMDKIEKPVSGEKLYGKFPQVPARKGEGLGSIAAAEMAAHHVQSGLGGGVFEIFAVARMENFLSDS